MNIKYRVADMNDLEKISKLFNSAIDDMNSKGINQWDDIYPNTDVLSSDIKNQEMYLAISEDEILSAFVINSQCDDEYKKLSGNIPSLHI